MHYSLRIGEQEFSVDIENLDSRPVVVEVDGERFEVWPEEVTPSNPKMDSRKHIEPNSAPADPCPPAPQPQAVVSSKCIIAPIPGVIITINVKPGQTVKRGEELCVLEAMKMKNSIRAGRDGVIATISTAVGDQVRHGQTLIEFSD